MARKKAEEPAIIETDPHELLDPHLMEEEPPEYYDVNPEYNSAGRLCNYHTGDEGEGETVRVMADEWERFNQLAGRQHRIADGIVVYDETLEPCMPDIDPDPVEELTARVEAQAEIIAHLLGAEVELSADVVRRATGMEAEALPAVQEQILALAKEPGVSKKL